MPHVWPSEPLIRLELNVVDRAFSGVWAQRCTSVTIVGIRFTHWKDHGY